MSKTAAMLASFLQIKPINKITENGTLEMVDRVRKREDGYRKLIELIRTDSGTDSLHFIIAHSSAPEIADEFKQFLAGNFNCLSLLITPYSPIMGYAVGPRCLFVGYRPAFPQID